MCVRQHEVNASHRQGNSSTSMPNLKCWWQTPLGRSKQRANKCSEQDMFHQGLLTLRMTKSNDCNWNNRGQELRWRRGGLLALRRRASLDYFWWVTAVTVAGRFAFCRTVTRSHCQDLRIGTLRPRHDIRGSNYMQSASNPNTMP